MDATAGVRRNFWALVAGVVLAVGLLSLAVGMSNEQPITGIPTPISALPA